MTASLLPVSTISVVQDEKSIIAAIYIIQIGDLSFNKEKHIADYMYNLFSITLHPILSAGTVAVYHQWHCRFELKFTIHILQHFGD